MPQETSIAILGPGLLGGSVALAVRKHLPAAEVRIWGRSAGKIDEIRRRGIAHVASTDACEVVRGASLVVFAMPVPAMAGIAASITDAVGANTVVTDVGSVKQCVVEQLEPLFAQFVGSHPMAGSDKTGIDAATDDLFEGATCLITPTPKSQPDALARVEAFWQALGARTLHMSLADHDRKVARISHMPHAVAFALIRAALLTDPTAVQCVGNGFRDATRIAASDPDLWTGILLENQAEVVSALADVSAQVQEVLALVRDGDKETLRRYLAEAQKLRGTVPAGASTHGND